MKKNNLIFFVAVLAVLFNSCSSKLTPFTERLYQENGWTDSDLKKIQFYVSEDIVLRRQASKGVSKIDHGEIKIVDGKRVEEIVIKKGTPGVFLFQPKGSRFAISFESRKYEDPYLVFGPSKRRGGRYTLRARDWNGNNGNGKITYDNKTYYTPSKSAYSVLLVDLKRIKDTKVKSRTAKGRTID